MVELVTHRGEVELDSWGYQLQGRRGSSLSLGDLLSASQDLLVVDFSATGRAEDRFSADEVAELADARDNRGVAAYISIGEASDYRSVWDPAWTEDGTALGRKTDDAPSWLGPVNPDFPESRKVRYWEQDWQDVLFNDAGTGWLDQIIAQGFDGAYLDIVDAYYFWASAGADKVRREGDPLARDYRDAAARMIDLIQSIESHAHEQDPDFFIIPQNGSFIVNDLVFGDGRGPALPDPAREAAYFDAISAIGIEDLYFRGGKQENNRFAPDKAQILELQEEYVARGEAVLVVEYLTNPRKIAKFIDHAESDGFIPFVAPDRDLDGLISS